MSDQAQNPFDLLLEQFRAIVREEIAKALNSRGNALLTPEELAEKLGLRSSNKNGEIETLRRGTIFFRRDR